MKRHRSRSLAAAAVLLTATGCASLSDVQLETRDYRRNDFKQQFLEYRQQCLSSGGRIVIDAKQALDRDGAPHRGDRYYCV
ncbi:MAG: hypothetical protein R3288_03890 [Woeseiaceae bacterium]|nr:hypothetical protein [Woeseiaceae bacterium]